MNGAVLYTRVSTADQAKDNNSLPVQEQRLRDYCRQNGLNPVRVFVDAGESARTTDRPQFQEMLAFCKLSRKRVSHLLVCNLSRFSRDVADTALTVATLENLGIKLVSVDEPVIDETAVGKLSRNILASFGQFFSDDLSEKTRYRMRAAVNEGRFVWVAPIGYLNENKKLVIDPERAAYVRKAFELIASGRYATGDAVLRAVTAMGLTTRKGMPLTKQTFARMLQNEIYTGWIVSGDLRVRGTHDSLISEELFQAVQDRLNGKSAPHKKLSEEFPLRGVVLCAKCKRPLTAGYVKGRTAKYPRYWCWNRECKSVGIRRDDLHILFGNLLANMQPTAKLLAELPERAANQWRERKVRIAKEAETLSKRLADQRTLNQKAITAKLNGKLSDDDFDSLKKSVQEEIFRIEGEITTLDSERSTMEELIAQAKVQAFDLKDTWDVGNVNQRQELARAFFPDGLSFSHELAFFEPSNTVIQQMATRFLDSLSNVGVPDGI